MAPDPKCSAVNAALQRSGMTYGQLASRVGVSEQRVITICTGADRPTDSEFNALASALGMANVPHSGAHTTK
ncbi:hypothetical protein GYMLUDRAFT_246982 [Collybiopsis luxurians FD-317 M1]|uniref:HTH cro/C1-type domain-containing protein n=1 Tax=Collybiopsis luxurians FD-317 M1 TaxID=944289 RepID=A0A0D0CGL9_9AGAR|nr:hypothetical protein GYMLUDRAFT_246982 [Collybiopsis luxurians FD-317 M1]